MRGSLASAAGARLLRRFPPERLVAVASLVAAVGLPLSALAFLRLQGFRYFGWGDTFVAYMAAAVGVVASVVFVPVLAMCLILPLALHLAGADHRSTNSCTPIYGGYFKLFRGCFRGNAGYQSLAG